MAVCAKPCVEEDADEPRQASCIRAPNRKPVKRHESQVMITSLCFKKVQLYLNQHNFVLYYVLIVTVKPRGRDDGVGLVEDSRGEAFF